MHTSDSILLFLYACVNLYLEETRKSCVILITISPNELIIVFDNFCSLDVLRSSTLVLVVGHEDGVVRTYQLPSVGCHTSCPKVIFLLKMYHHP